MPVPSNPLSKVATRTRYLPVTGATALRIWAVFNPEVSPRFAPLAPIGESRGGSQCCRRSPASEFRSNQHPQASVGRGNRVYKHRDIAVVALRVAAPEIGTEGFNAVRRHPSGTDTQRRDIGVIGLRRRPLSAHDKSCIVARLGSGLASDCPGNKWPKFDSAAGQTEQRRRHPPRENPSKLLTP